MMIRIVAMFVVAMSVSSVAKAQAVKAALFQSETGTIQVVEKAENSFDVLYAASAETQVKVNIRNEENRIVYTEVLRNKSNFRRPYSLATLPDGKYTFEVKGLLGTYTQSVVVE